MNAQEAQAVRRIVARWLSIRADHANERRPLYIPNLPPEGQAQLFKQLSADADHSDLLTRLLKGEEPLPFDEWKERYLK